MYVFQVVVLSLSLFLLLFVSVSVVCVFKKRKRKINIYNPVQNLHEASQNLTMWGYLPGDEFPNNQTIRESECMLTRTLDNWCNSLFPCF